MTIGQAYIQRVAGGGIHSFRQWPTVYDLVYKSVLAARGKGTSLPTSCYERGYNGLRVTRKSSMGETSTLL